MATIVASTNDSTNLFLLDGLDRAKGVYTIYYDSVEKNSSGVIDETKIRVGLQSKYEGVRTLIMPQLLKNWTNGVIPYGQTDATGTITLASAVANTYAFGTVTLVSALALDTVTVNGLVYTAVAGVRSDNTEFSIDTSDAAAGIDLAAAITGDVRTGTNGGITATDNGSGVVTFTTDVLGTGGNAITLVSSNGTRLAVTGSGTLTGGVTADTVVINSNIYTAVAGARANNTQFSIDTSNDAAATDLAAAITADTRSGVNDITAAAVAAVVTATADGADGNTTTLTSSSGTRLAVSGSGVFTGGVDGTLDDVVAAISPLIAFA